MEHYAMRVWYVENPEDVWEYFGIHATSFSGALEQARAVFRSENGPHGEIQIESFNPIG